MKIRFSKELKKSLASAVEQCLLTKKVYLGTPSMGYRIGAYTVDKYGTLEGEDNQELLDGLALLGFVGEAEVPVWIADLAARLDGENKLLGSGEADEQLPEEAPQAVEQLPEEAPQADEKSPEEAPQADEQSPEETPQADEQLPEEAPTAPTTVRVPDINFSDTALINLRALIASRAPLLQKVLGLEEEPLFFLDVGEIKFSWFPECSDDDLDAYCLFIHALCRAAKTRQRVRGTVPPVVYENEKFAMRTFLVQLGLKGAEYKRTRELMMRNLTGNSAFRSGQPSEAWYQRWVIDRRKKASAEAETPITEEEVTEILDMESPTEESPAEEASA
jgi:hypothetical protein